MRLLFLKKGFTLVETLVSIAVIILVGLAIANFQRDLFFFNSSLQNNLSAQIDARKVLRTVLTELRTTSPSSLGAYPLVQVGTSTLIFYANVDGDQYKERLRYFTQGTNFMRGVTKPAGNPLVYNLGQEQVDTVVRDVVNGTSTPIFEYFDNSFTGTSSPLTQPVDPLVVRLIRVTVIIDKDPNRAPSRITVTSQGMLRNLKDNL